MRSIGVAVALLLVLAAGVGRGEAPRDDRRRTGPAAKEAKAEPEQPKVRSIDWEGVKAVSRDELEDAVLTSEPTWKFWQPTPRFDELVLVGDMERIADFYRLRGYYGASASYTLDWNDDRTSVAIRIRVEEGEPVHLEALRIEFTRAPGLDPAARAELRNGLELVEGEVFSALRYGASRRALLERLANRGHPSARLEGGAEVDLNTHRASVDWRVVPGPLVRFGPISFEGLEDVAEKVVLRELAFEPGDVYSQEAIRRSERDVFDLELFRSVAIEAQPPEQSGEAEGEQPVQGPGEVTWPVEARIRERPFRSIRVGVGFGTEELARGQIQWEHRYFGGDLRRVTLSAEGSFLGGQFDARLRQPYFLRPELTLLLASGYRRDLDRSFEADRARGLVQLERPLAGSWSGRVGSGVEWGNLVDLDASGPRVDAADGHSTLAFLELGAGRSTLDDPVDPRRGSWIDLSVTPAVPLTRAGVASLRLTAEGRAFLPLGPLTLAGRLRAATLQPFGARAEEVPVFERFFSGGSTTVRGFSYHKLGILDADGEPTGGLTEILSSLELRFPIWRQFGGVLFVDGGELAPDAFSLAETSYRFSAGAGLRIRTPIGPLRFDFGRLLNRPPGVDASQIHVSVGQAF